MFIPMNNSPYFHVSNTAGSLNPELDQKKKKKKKEKETVMHSRRERERERERERSVDRGRTNGSFNLLVKQFPQYQYFL